MKSRIFEIIIYSESDLKKAKEIAKDCEKISKCYYIKHNKDIGRKGEEIKKHYHFLIRYNNSVRLSVISGLFEFISINLIEIKNNWKASVQYLIHLNHSNKYNYRLEDIIILKGTRSELIGELTKDKAKDSEIFKMLKNKIMKEEIISFNQARQYCVEQGSENIYFDKLNHIEKLIKGVELSREENKEKNMSVILICGRSGIGKTTYVKDYSERTNKTLYEATSKNIFDQYKDEKLVVFNEYKESFFNNISESEHLQLLDNHYNSNVSARYKNKNISNVEILFLTTSLTKNEVLELYKVYYPNSVDEFKRRITLIIELNKDEIIVYSHQNSEFEFFEVKRKKNNIFKNLEQKRREKKNKERELLEKI